MTGSTISENSARDGGGICNDGELTVTNSLILDNTAIENGGGTFNFVTGELIVTDCVIADNSAGHSGGGIYNEEGGMLTVTDSEISRNTAANDLWGYGGGICSFGETTVDDCIIADNTCIVSDGSSLGGGIFNADGKMTVTNSTISGNTAVYGGGIYNDGEMTVTNCEIMGNNAEASFYHSGGSEEYPIGSEGGGIYSWWNLTVTNCLIAENFALRGAGIYNEYGTVNVTNSTITGNILGCGMTLAGGNAKNQQYDHCRKPE